MKQNEYIPDIKNLRQIKEMGLDLWIERGNRYWFGDLDKKQKI